MYTVTIINYEGKKVSSEAFLNEEAAQKEWENLVEKYKAQSSNLEGEKTTKENNGGKAWAYEHEGFGAYLTKTEGGYQLIEGMSVAAIASYLEEEKGFPDNISFLLKKETTLQILEEVDGIYSYSLRFDNLIKEMEAKKIAEQFNKS